MSMQEKRFEAWWCEREGIGLRAERFSAPDEAAWAAWQAAEAVAIERCARIVETYEVSIGNSSAGEMACEMTMANLREIRDAIRAMMSHGETS